MFGETIRESFEALGLSNSRGILYIEQEERKGTAEAMQQVASLLQEVEASDSLVVYADMPFWTRGTLEVLRSLHERGDAVLSLATASLSQAHPLCLEAYGRIIRSSSGGIVRVAEVAEATPQELQDFRTVNPSLWIWNLEWLQANVPFLPWHSKDDRHPERDLPKLIERAAQQGLAIQELPLGNAWEAIGINTQQDLCQAEIL